MAEPHLVVVVVAAVAGLFMAWSIGAVAIGGGAFSPAVGAGAIPVRRAAILLAAVGFVGALLQGASVTRSLGSGLVRGATPTPLAASVAILCAAVLMAAGAVRDYPIPAAFTVSGATVAAGLALGGSPAWRTYGQFAALWIVAPVLVAAVSYLVEALLTREDLPAQYGVGAITAVVAASLPLLEFPFLAAGAGTRSLAGAVAALVPPLAAVAWVGFPVAFATGGAWAGYETVLEYGQQETSNQLLVWLGMLVAFSGAGNQIGLAVGPLLPLLDATGTSTWPVLVVAATGLVVGAMTGAPRLIEAVATEYATLSHSRGIAALVPAFLVSQVGIVYGVPVSFNEIIISAIVGSGLATGGTAAVEPGKLYYTVLAWVGSLACAGAVTYGTVLLLAGAGIT